MFYYWLILASLELKLAQDTQYGADELNKLAKINILYSN